MSKDINEHDQVVSYIRDSFTKLYDVKSNLDKEEHYVGSMFPDLIFLDKNTQKPVFILEVRRNGEIANCIQQWKTVQNIPATLYIIVYEDDLQNAKSIAQVVGLQARFGTYKIDGDNIIVKYD